MDNKKASLMGLGDAFLLSEIYYVVDVENADYVVGVWGVGYG